MVIHTSWGGVFPDTGMLDGMFARGAVPMITWRPLVTPAEVLTGKHDRYIRAWAQAAKAYGRPILLRFAHEMSGGWYAWGVKYKGNTAAGERKMWRHVWDIFKGPGGVGATNVLFVWCPMQAHQPGEYARIWPGDKYVDYPAFDAYNMAKTAYKGGHWQSTATLYGESYRQLRALTSKPILVPETGSVSQGGDKTAWLDQGYDDIWSQFPGIVGMVYFDVDWQGPSGPQGFGLDPGTPDLQAYRAIAADPRYGASFGS